MVRRIFLVGFCVIAILFITPFETMAAGKKTVSVNFSTVDLYTKYLDEKNKGYNFYMTDNDVKTLMLSKETVEFYIVTYEDSTIGKVGMIYSNGVNGSMFLDIDEDAHTMTVKMVNGGPFYRWLAGGEYQATPGGSRIYGNYIDDSGKIYHTNAVDPSKYEETEPVPEPEPEPEVTPPPEEEDDDGGISLNPIDWFNGMGDKLKEWFVPSSDYTGYDDFLDALKGKFPHFFVIYDSFSDLSERKNIQTRPQVKYGDVELIPYHFFNQEVTVFFGTYRIIDLMKLIMTTVMSFTLAAWILRKLSPQMTAG